MITRRQTLRFGLGLAALAGLPLRPFAASSVNEGMRSSDLIYLSPIKSNGELSRCQAEVWFVEYQGAMYVCTATESWRARAPRQGRNRAKVWVGDVGVWTRSEGEYKNLPSTDAAVSIVEDKAVNDTLLERFGDKYPLGWIRWGGDFRRGLEDGSRTMLKYQPVATS